MTPTHDRPEPSRVLVAGVDSSTQSCKVVVRDAATGALVRSGRAAHPAGTEVDPGSGERALDAAVAEAGGLDDVAAAVGRRAAARHGRLDADGEVVRPALLWNDTRSAGAAADLIAELGGAQAWADAVGLVPVASFTVTKLRWLADARAGRGGPHRGRLPAARLADLAPRRHRRPGRAGDRPRRRQRHRLLVVGLGDYRDDLLELRAARPRAVGCRGCSGRREAAGRTRAGAVLGPGAGDNAASALGLGAGPATSSSRSAPPAWPAPSPRRRSPTAPGRGRLRRRHRPLPAAGRHA